MTFDEFIKNENLESENENTTIMEIADIIITNNESRDDLYLAMKKIL
jgi:hypothetical protein